MQVTDHSMRIAGRRTLTWQRVVTRGWDGKVVDDYLTGGAIDDVPVTDHALAGFFDPSYPASPVSR